MAFFFRDESGATLIEYGIALILAIALGGGALVTLAGQVSNTMYQVCESLQVEGNPTSPDAEDCSTVEEEE